MMIKFLWLHRKYYVFFVIKDYKYFLIKILRPIFFQFHKVVILNTWFNTCENINMLNYKLYSKINSYKFVTIESKCFNAFNFNNIIRNERARK